MGIRPPEKRPQKPAADLCAERTDPGGLGALAAVCKSLRLSAAHPACRSHHLCLKLPSASSGRHSSDQLRHFPGRNSPTGRGRSISVQDKNRFRPGGTSSAGRHAGVGLQTAAGYPQAGIRQGHTPYPLRPSHVLSGRQRSL